MKLKDLVKALDKLERLLAAYEHIYLGIVPADWNNAKKLYYAAQARALRSIDDAGKSVLERGLLPGGGVLLVCGSISRLEFAPGASDVDCLAILDHVGADSKVFKGFKTKLSASIRWYLGKAESELRKEFSLKKVPRRKKAVTVDVCGVPGPPDTLSKANSEDLSSRAKPKKRPKLPLFFYTERDIFDSVGKEREPAYAAGERAHLLCQHAFVGGAIGFHKALEARAEREQRALDDLQRQAFPLLCFSFVTSMMWSGGVATTALIRSKEDKEVDELVAKVTLGRLWSARTNVLALHMLYWESVIGEAVREEVTGKRVLEVLQTPTVCKLVKLFPELIDILLGKKVMVWAAQQKVSRKDLRKEVVAPLHRIHRALSTAIVSDTMTKCFLDLLVHCIGVRTSPTGLKEGQLQCIKKANEMFSVVMRIAEGVTQSLRKRMINPPTLHSYARLMLLMPDELSPIVGQATEPVAKRRGDEQQP